MIMCLVTAAWMSCTTLTAPHDAGWLANLFAPRPPVSAEFVQKLKDRSVPVGLMDPAKLAATMALAVGNLAPKAIADGDQSKEAR